MGSGKRAKVGDVIELPTSQGLAYIQYSTVDDNRENGPLVRVLPGLLDERPQNLTDLVQQKERFFAYVDVGGLIRRPGVRIIGNFPVPERAQGIPMMKVPLHVQGEEDIFISQKWFLTDGIDEWYVGELTPEQEELSIEEDLWYEDLVDRIESGWSPRDYVKKDQVLTPGQEEEEEFLIAGKLLPDEFFEEVETAELPPGARVEHFLLCSRKSQAMRTARALEAAGYSTTVSQEPDDEELPWHIVAEPPDHESRGRDEQTDELERLATQYGAVYEGRGVRFSEEDQPN